MFRQGSQGDRAVISLQSSRRSGNHVVDVVVVVLLILPNVHTVPTW